MTAIMRIVGWVFWFLFWLNDMCFVEIFLGDNNKIFRVERRRNIGWFFLDGVLGKGILTFFGRTLYLFICFFYEFLKFFFLFSRAGWAFNIFQHLLFSYLLHPWTAFFQNFHFPLFLKQHILRIRVRNLLQQPIYISQLLHKLYSHFLILMRIHIPSSFNPSLNDYHAFFLCIFLN